MREETFSVTAAGIVVGRNELPDRLMDWYLAGRLDEGDALAEAITDAWTGAEWPTRYLHRRDWIEMFETAGFISDNGRARPAEPMELYRAQVGRTYGMSWTEDRELAEWFHQRNGVMFDSGRVLLRGTVEPDGVLAIFEDQRSGYKGYHSGPVESEVVVNPAYLRRPVERL